jgi:hypothetical protein
MIPREKWKYRGMPGHFCGSRRCRFHLCTAIGNYLISSVGAYYADESGPMQMIRCDRHYETLVFKLNSDGAIEDYSEVDGDSVELKPGMDPHKADRLAEEMHDRMCVKYAERQK